MTQDDAKTVPWLFFLRRRRCLTLLIGSTFVLLVLFVLQNPGLNSKSRRLWKWASTSTSQSFWPHESAKVEDMLFPPDKPTYVLFEPPSLTIQMVPSLSSSSPSSVVRPVQPLSSRCLDAHFENGETCAASTPDPPIDVLWTWVNGSDRLLMESMAQAVRRSDPKMPTTSRPNTELFRDHNELLHSVRSVLQHFRSSTTQLHILTSDFPFNLPIIDGDTTIDSPRRLGLVPSWLNMTDPPVWRDGDVRLSMTYHSQIFRDYQGVFNSYAIESQIKNMQGLSDNFVYMNDDFFMLADLTKSDFYTSTYGTVIRLQADLQVSSDANPRVQPGGEWGPLGYTNWCLSNRFGTRSRPYIAHTAKSLSLPLMSEFQSMWQPQLEVTATHPFRGMTSGNRDVYAIFLFTHTLVERWREALLWSWAIARIGPLDGRWGTREREEAWRSVGGVGGGGDRPDVEVKSTYRSSAQPDEIRKNLKAAGHSLSGRTEYVFVSGDGYPYGFTQTRPRRVSIFPKFTSSPATDENGNSNGQVLCQLSYSKCFKQPSVTASDFFKYIAFEQLECGDCIINALRAKSGSSGLSAFLPPHDKVYTSVWEDDEDEDDEDTLNNIDMDAIAKMDLGDLAFDGGDDDDINESRSHDSSFETTPSFSPPPHLPLVSHYQEGDFSLTEVLPKHRRGGGGGKKTDIREWTLQLLQRYRFVLGDTPTRFQMITSLNDARSKLKQVEMDKNAALLCINDNIRGASAGQADIFIRNWQDKLWSDKASWEKR